MNDEPNKPVELTEKELEGVVGGARDGREEDKGNKISLSAPPDTQFFQIRVKVK